MNTYTNISRYTDIYIKLFLYVLKTLIPTDISNFNPISQVYSNFLSKFVHPQTMRNLGPVTPTYLLN